MSCRVSSPGEHPLALPTRRAIRKAISIVEDSRLSHVVAIEEPESQILGDEKFHKLCVRDYEFVLGVLRQVLDQ